MKRTGLILLACLLLALPTVAQAPEKAAPDDLVVTAEIVGYEFVAITSPKGKPVRDSKPILSLSAKMMIRNNTNHQREIVVMRCSWHWAWTSKGAYSICGPNGCDGNSPEPIITAVTPSCWRASATRCLLGSSLWLGRERLAVGFGNGPLPEPPARSQAAARHRRAPATRRVTAVIIPAGQTVEFYEAV